MPEFRLTTPVAFIIFNRPDTTARVFAEIAKARPPKLLIIGDGPRENRIGEIELVAETRAIIELVDWPCEVLTNISETNLGCRKRVSSGIDWVFNQVDEAIILEDDCLPDPSFFRFCEEMLVRYRHDQRIGMISGDNFLFRRRYGSDSYYFSKYVHIWGWATWRNRWQDSYDVNMLAWPIVRDNGRVVDLVGDAKEVRYWRTPFERTYRGEVDTWDYQWNFANWLNGRLNIMPMVNLISNIGFGEHATHTVSKSDVSCLPVEPIEFPLVHPVGIFRNVRADFYSFRRANYTPMWKRIYRKLCQLLD